MSSARTYPAGARGGTVTRIGKAPGTGIDCRNARQFLDEFLRNRKFSVEDAVQLGKKQDDSAPHSMNLKPKAADVACPQLEIATSSFLGRILFDIARGHYPSVSLNPVSRNLFYEELSRSHAAV